MQLYRSLAFIHAKYYYCMAAPGQDPWGLVGWWCGPCLPECLEKTAWTKQGEIMGLRHRDYAIEGIQFHPESVATPFGLQLLENFLLKKNVTG